MEPPPVQAHIRTVEPHQLAAAHPQIQQAIAEDQPLPSVPRTAPSEWADEDPGRQLIHESPYLTLEERVEAIRAINQIRAQRQAVADNEQAAAEDERRPA